jgi:hypothetical protein
MGKTRKSEMFYDVKDIKHLDLILIRFGHFLNRFNKKPSVEHLRVMGCRAYIHVPDELRKKLDSKAQQGWLVGYGEDSKGWIVWEPISRKFMMSRDFIFNEDLLISDFYGDMFQNKNGLFDPFLLSMEILGLIKINNIF